MTVLRDDDKKRVCVPREAKSCSLSTISLDAIFHQVVQLDRMLVLANEKEYTSNTQFQKYKDSLLLFPDHACAEERLRQCSSRSLEWNPLEGEILLVTLDVCVPINRKFCVTCVRVRHKNRVEMARFKLHSKWLWWGGCIFSP